MTSGSSVIAVSGYDAHETAFVEPDTRIGPGTKIWHNAHVRGTAEIGSDCVLGKNVYIDVGVRIGDRTKIQNNVSVYLGVTLGDEVFVGPSAVFTNDRFPRAETDDWEVVPTEVRRGASIGANATIICGVTIDEFATVAAGAVVTRDLESHELVGGNPARRMGWVCECGRVVTREDTRPADLHCDRCV